MKIQSKHFVLSLLLAMGAAQSNAAVIGFDDLDTRNNFDNLGISNTYAGYIWSSSGSTGEGWAVATTSQPISGPMSTPVSGNTIAWNWDGVQSLYINFGAATNVKGAWIATGYDAGDANAKSVKMLGYDIDNNLVATSSSLSPTFAFQHLEAGFTGIYRLAIQANAESQWFAVDSIEVNPTVAAVPEPTSIVMMGLGLAAIGLIRRKKA